MSTPAPDGVTGRAWRAVLSEDVPPPHEREVPDMTDATDLDPRVVTVLKLLARGRAPAWVAQATDLKESTVRELGERHGWPSLPALRARLAAAGVEDAGQHVPAPGPRPTPMPTQDHRAHPDAERQQASALPNGRLEVMLARAGKHDTAAINTARNAVLSAMTRLEGALQKAETKFRETREKETAKAAAKARVALLEKQLREAKAALRPRNVAEKSASEPRSGEDPKVVRAWAREHGVTCPDRGRVPATVVEQFRAAATQEAQTA